MNTDLVRNPLIGGSKGVTMAQATSEDLDELKGDNTFENDTSPRRSRQVVPAQCLSEALCGS
jgi:hypothetical protein